MRYGTWTWAPFWPILLVYFVALFALTMKRQIKHMWKHNYVPWSRGKTRYGEDGGAAPAKPVMKQMGLMGMWNKKAASTDETPPPDAQDADGAVRRRGYLITGTLLRGSLRSNLRRSYPP